MCEPNHSIVQYPEDCPGDGGPTTQLLEPSVKKGLLEFGKRFWKWLHFSKLGTGHSEAIRAMGTFSALIPEETRYEARWWDRTVVLDGYYRGEGFDKKPALEAATCYAKVVSIGSLTALRQFLEVSLRKSERVRGYLSRFLDDFLNPKGRDYTSQRLKQCFNTRDLYLLEKQLGWYGLRESPANFNETLEKLIRVLLGVTRKRNFLNPAWADDGSLWSPGQVLEMPKGLVVS